MVKLVNQILVVNTHMAVCEALLFAQAGGLDLETNAKSCRAVAQPVAGCSLIADRR